MSNLIDLFDKDMLVSEMQEGISYIVCSPCGLFINLCKRSGNSFYTCAFKFDLSLDFAVRIEDNTRVQGYHRKECRHFGEHLQFNKVTIKELVFYRLPNFIETVYGMGYVKELVPAVVMTK